MRWFVSLLVALVLAAPASAQLRTIPICEKAPEGFRGECLPQSWVNQREFTTFLVHMLQAIGTRCSFGVKDPSELPTRQNLVLLSCPELSLEDLPAN